MAQWSRTLVALADLDSVQHPHDGSQPSTLVPRVLTPSSDLMSTRHTLVDKHMKSKHSYIKIF